MCISNLFYNEGGDSACSCVYVRLCVHDQDVRVRSVRDPKLVPVQNIVVILKGHKQSEQKGKNTTKKRGLFQSKADLKRSVCTG